MSESLEQRSNIVTHEMEADGVKLSLSWDGFCLTIESDKFAFVASVNDPTVSYRGNTSIIFGTADEIAKRMPA